MKYIITESQYKLISELERHWMDFEYEKQYNRIKDKIIPYIIDKVYSYDDDGGRIDEILFMDSDNIPIMVYKVWDYGGELFVHKDFNDEMSEIFPHPIWSIHGKYIMSDVFNHFYPDRKVLRLQDAYITT